MFSNDLILKIINYLDNNLYKKVSIDELTRIFHYNKDYIMRLFKREIGFTIVQYVNNKRIYNSLPAFNSKDLSILNISINYGFYSQEYYCEIFHKVIGVPPSTYYKFINLNHDISEKDISLIQFNVALLEYKFRRINEYLNNIPPKSTIKVLSVFK